MEGILKLTKRYRDNEVVSNLSFFVEKGEVFALLGANGAGKTTTIKMILGLAKQDDGVIEFPYGVRIGYSHETPYFSPYLTGMEVLRYYAGIQKEMLNHGEYIRLLKLVGMEDSRTRVRNYSKDFQNAPLTYQEIIDSISEMEKKNLELLAQSLSRHGNVEEQTAEEIISKNWPAEPFLVMDELYTDGSSLYFSAHTPEGCSIRPTDTRDHAYVNGVDCMAEYFEASEEPGHFVGAIDLSTNFSDQDFLKIGEELAILMPLYTKPDTDISDWTDWKLFSFSDPNWKESVATRDLSGKEITLGEYGSVKLEKLLVSPSKIKIKMICTMVGDNAKELLARYGYSKTMEDMVKEFHFIPHRPSPVTEAGHRQMLPDLLLKTNARTM